MTFTIRHGDFSLELSILPVSQLKPHEETLPSGVNEIKSSLNSVDLQYDPVIVDSKTNVILDGMHRHRAMQELNFRLILVCSVNYLDDRIGVKRWLRTALLKKDFIEEIASKIPLEQSEEYARVMKMVDLKESCLGILGAKVSYYVKECRNIEEQKSMVRIFDSYASLRNVRIEYVTEESILQKINDGFFVLYTQIPTKYDVINSALTGRLFPPKSTRHTVPARPVGIGLPLHYLSEERSESEKKLEEFVRSRSFVAMPPGSYYSGRKYEETIYLLL